MKSPACVLALLAFACAGSPAPSADSPAAPADSPAAAPGESTPEPATSDAGASDAVTADATLENNLPADGCTWAIRVGDETFAPDAASVAEIEEFTGSQFGATPARLTYRLTGRTGSMECGWGTKQAAPEIEVLRLDSAAPTP